MKRSATKERKARVKDIALILDRTEDRQGFHIVRQRAEDPDLQFGTIRPLKEGQPIDGEVVTLKPRKDAPMVFDVKVQLPDTRRPGDKPARVATQEYRKGWDAIWGKRAPTARLN